MELTILTETESKEYYKTINKYSKIEPIKIEKDFYILARDLKKIVQSIEKLPFFSIGDNSEYDKRYNEYLKAQEEEL